VTAAPSPLSRPRDLRLLVYRRVDGRSPWPKRFWTFCSPQRAEDRIILRLAARILGAEDSLPPICAVDRFWLGVAHVEVFLARVLA